MYFRQFFFTVALVMVGIILLTNGSTISTPCQSDEKDPWSYDDNLPNGPSKWNVRYELCGLKMQSPINIDTNNLMDSDANSFESINYDVPFKKMTYSNRGYTVQLQPHDEVDRFITVNNTLYKLRWIHFHWGDKESVGSEHFIDNIQLSMEMSLYHYNSTIKQYAVLSLLFRELVKARNPEMEKLVKPIGPGIKYRGESKLGHELYADYEDFNLKKIIGYMPFYYFYLGSDTEPPCGKNPTLRVISPIIYKIKKDQLDGFRNLQKNYAETDEMGRRKDADPLCKLVNNFRPLQNLGDRIVYKST